MESTVDIGGTAYRLTSDDGYLESVGSSFEPETVSLLKTLAHGIALDIGANIGCTALAMSQVCERVYAFEPSPSTHHLLHGNVAGQKNILTLNFGLGLKDRRETITFAPNNRAGGFIASGVTANGIHNHESIVVHKLDAVTKKHGIDRVDFMKIDVEGFEENVLRGSKKTLKRFHPVVALELNHWCLNVFQRKSLPDFLDFLRSVFPVLYAVQGDTYADLHDAESSYVVMHRHIHRNHYVALVGGFDLAELDGFRSKYRETLNQ